jgi:alanine racemase
MSETAVLRTRTSVDLNVLESNYRAIQARVAPGVGLLSIIKADAYGHGAVEAGRRLASIGAPYFGVATIDEGRELREGGITIPILVLSGVMPWESVQAALQHRLTPVVADFDALERLAGLREAEIRVHIKIDTGMGRLGFVQADLDRLTRRLRELPHVRVEGLMSHFASSEKRDDYGLAQVRDFTGAAEFLKERGITPKLLHMANSGAICEYPEAHFTMVRPGIMLYGSYSDPVLEGALQLGPVLTWSARVGVVREFPAGLALSYGRTYITGRRTKIAYIPVGYADGYPRALSNRGSVLVRGRRCPVVGRVCMDWIFVDVTEAGEVAPGEEVVLLGGSGNEAIRADDVAAQAGTIPYEVLCGISRCIPRHYVY